MALPWLAAIASNPRASRWFFATDLAGAPDPPSRRPADMPVFVLVVLGLTLAGFAVTSLARTVTCLGGAGGCRGAGRTRPGDGAARVAGIAAAANVPFLAFVLCLGVVVTAVMQHGLDDAMRDVLPTGTTLPALLGIAVAAAVLSNVVNNLPAVLVLLPLVAGRARRRPGRADRGERRTRT